MPEGINPQLTSHADRADHRPVGIPGGAPAIALQVGGPAKHALPILTGRLTFCRRRLRHQLNGCGVCGGLVVVIIGVEPQHPLDGLADARR